MSIGTFEVRLHSEHEILEEHEGHLFFEDVRAFLSGFFVSDLRLAFGF